MVAGEEREGVEKKEERMSELPEGCCWTKLMPSIVRERGRESWEGSWKSRGLIPFHLSPPSFLFFPCPTHQY